MVGGKTAVDGGRAKIGEASAGTEARAPKTMRKPTTAASPATAPAEYWPGGGPQSVPEALAPPPLPHSPASLPLGPSAAAAASAAASAGDAMVLPRATRSCQEPGRSLGSSGAPQPESASASPPAPPARRLGATKPRSRPSAVVARRAGGTPVSVAAGLPAAAARVSAELEVPRERGDAAVGGKGGRSRVLARPRPRPGFSGSVPAASPRRCSVQADACKRLHGPGARLGCRLQAAARTLCFPKGWLGLSEPGRRLPFFRVPATLLCGAGRRHPRSSCCSRVRPPRSAFGRAGAASPSPLAGAASPPPPRSAWRKCRRPGSASNLSPVAQRGGRSGAGRPAGPSRGPGGSGPAAGARGRLGEPAGGAGEEP